jgi:hypothetical protein
MNAHWAELIARERAVELRRDADRMRPAAADSRSRTTMPADARPRRPALIGRLVIAFRRGLA